MRSAKTLGEARELVESASRSHRDRVVPLEALRFRGLGTVEIEGTPHPAGPTARKAFCAKLGVPLGYLERCPDRIQAENLNYWLDSEIGEGRPEFLLRMDGERIRAVFTPRYKPFDNVEVLDELHRLGYGDGVGVRFRIDDDFMSLALLNEERNFRVGRDEMTPGTSVVNSETGLSSLKVSTFFLRLVCTNGMVAGTVGTARLRHVSEKTGSRLKELLEGASVSAGREIELLRKAREIPVEDFDEALERIASELKPTPAERKALKEAVPLEYGPSFFNVLNVYTRAARSPKLSVASSDRLQRFAGALLARAA